MLNMTLPRLDEFNTSLVELSQFARALSHPARIAILQLLGTRGELPAMEIVAELPLSQPACSRHLKELVLVGLLSSRNERNKVYYHLESKSLDSFCQRMAKSLHS